MGEMRLHRLRLPGSAGAVLFLSTRASILEFISIYSILGLHRKEAMAMGTLRFAALQTRPPEVLDVTRLTVAELQPLVPPFEAAFQAHLASWRLDGKLRPARRYTTDTNCPLRTPEDRLWCILVDLKTYPRQVVQGGCSAGASARRLSGFMASGWCCGRRCARWGRPRPGPVTALAQRLGVAEAPALAPPPPL